LLEDAEYEKQLQRLSGLPKFPQVPAAQKELVRALRRISDSDKDFLHKLISDVIDTATVCPTPADLIQRAGAKRQHAHASIGHVDCPHCHGSGFVTTLRKVSVAGIAPYETEFAAACKCRGGN
jgi:hypothetical protein